MRHFDTVSYRVDYKLRADLEHQVGLHQPPDVNWLYELDDYFHTPDLIDL